MSAFIWFLVGMNVGTALGFFSCSYFKTWARFMRWIKDGK